MSEEKSTRKRVSKQNQELMDVGKLPPQAVELEEAVLGAIMLDKEVLPIIAGILKPESFYKDQHMRIYQAALSLHRQSYPVDVLTIRQELIRTGDLDNVGGMYFLSTLTNKVSSAANTEFHARIVQQKFIARELIRIGTLTINDAYEDGSDIFDMMEGLEKRLTALTGNILTGKAAKTPAKLWAELEERNANLIKSTGLNGVPSGYPAIDKLTAGWQKGHLIIIGARPSMGKTALAMCLARNAAADFGKPVAVFSLEMSALELLARLATAESEVSNNRIIRKGVDPEEFHQITEKCVKLINCPMYIDDTPGLTMQELASKARKLVREFGVEMLVVDYLQLMRGETYQRGNREQEIAGISRGLKTLAKELDIPVIALSQLSRGVETRGGQKRPMLSDLRESGAIEQDADEVIFLHRSEYYGITEDENGFSTAGDAELDFAKHRNGPTGVEHLTWIARLTKFVDKIDPVLVQKTEEVKQPHMYSNPDEFLLSKKNKEDDDHPF